MRCFIILLHLLLLSSIAFAKDIPSIGFIDIEYVIEQSHLNKKYYSLYGVRKEKFLSQKKKYNTLLTQAKIDLYQKQTLFGYQELQSKLALLQNKVHKYEEELINIKNSLQEWENTTFSKLLDDLLLVLQILSSEYNIHLILSKEPNIIWYNKTYDYTQKAINILNDINDRNKVEFK